MHFSDFYWNIRTVPSAQLNFVNYLELDILFRANTMEFIQSIYVNVIYAPLWNN